MAVSIHLNAILGLSSEWQEKWMILYSQIKSEWYFTAGFDIVEYDGLLQKY